MTLTEQARTRRKRWARRLWTWTKQKAITSSHSDRGMDSRVDTEAISDSIQQHQPTRRSGQERGYGEGDDRWSRTDLVLSEGEGTGQDDRAGYGAKKSGGDVKRKGRVDPYAHVPLTVAAEGTQGHTAFKNQAGLDRAPFRRQNHKQFSFLFPLGQDRAE